MNIITIFCTVVIINYNYRTPRTHKMPYWIRRLCIDILPRILRMERPKKYEKEDYFGTSEADRAKQSMLNYMQASRALSIAAPMLPTHQTNNANKNSVNHSDQAIELKKRQSSKKKHQRAFKRQQQHLTVNQSSTSDDDDDVDDEENHLTTQEIDLLLTKEAYEAAEDLSFIANHMRSACHYEEVNFECLH